MEYKVGRETNYALPHIFIGLKKVPEGISEQELDGLINSVWLGSSSNKQIKTIHRCLSQVPKEGYLFQLGFSPFSAVIRLCFKFHDARHIFPFLKELGLAEQEQQAISFIEDFSPYLHSFCIHFDVNDNLMPQVGVELHIDENPLELSVQSHWESIFTKLVMKGVCLESKKDTLLKWHGCSYEDLDSSLDQYLTYRFLYYLKAVFIPGASVRVKAYFGFINRKPELDKVLSNSSRVLIEKKINNSPKQAVEQGLLWLKKVQLPQGEFKTYLSPSPSMEYSRYDSSPFVTCGILYNLSFLDHPVVEGIQKKAKFFLTELADKNFLWRYWTPRSQKKIDPDMDDTCLISFVLQKIFNIEEIAQNKAILLANRNEDGLFSTWIRKKNAPNDVDTVVNANAILYLGQNPLCGEAAKYIMDCIRVGWEDGSYWYYLNNLSLYYAVARAYANGIRAFADITGLITEKILVEQLENGSFHTPLQTAMALCTLLNFNYPKDNKTFQAINFLLNSQTESGYWPEEAFYCGPEPPHRHVWFGSRELTTGVCLEALARYYAI
ncbi:MAG: terpene cyclase/mutase family protein [Spirochaetales bacterium]|nr:terpene cyclase/mutase family protein [Spirochaetales bacterium]